jgi:hypothetical protein
MSAENNPSLSLVDPYPSGQDAVQRIALGAFAIGLLALVIAAFGPGKEFPQVFFWLAVVLGPVGATVYVARSFLLREPGVRNEHIWHRSLFNPWCGGLGVRSAAHRVLCRALLGTGELLERCRPCAGVRPAEQTPNRKPGRPMVPLWSHLHAVYLGDGRSGHRQIPTFQLPDGAHRLHHVLPIGLRVPHPRSS